MKNKFFYIKKILAVFLLALFLLSSCNKTSSQYSKYVSKPLGEGYAVVQFLDVGQADCSLISLPNGKNILIDAGNKADGEKIADYLVDLGIVNLDYIICTHPHEDHIGGMAEVIARLNFNHIIMPLIADEDVDGSEIYETLLITVAKLNKKITTAVPGVILSENGLKIECLAPLYSSYGNMNDYSAVMMISYGETEILFTGDAEKASEHEMLSISKDKLDADILKVGHHGSSTATSEELLEATTPEYAVISCGKNNQYNHPHKEVIDRLNGSNCETLRTDISGSIIFYIDTEGIVNHLTTKEICLNGD